jgi:phospholipase A1
VPTKLSGHRRIFIHVCFVLALILTPVAAAADTPAPPDVPACSEIPDSIERLACYDRLAEREKTYSKRTFMERQWDLIPHEEKRTFVLRPHRTNYILVAAYNDSPNEYVPLENDEDAKAQDTEAKFQISFKARTWEQMFGLPVDFWLAYTQLSFWQLYNSALSSPFRDTNYEPEALFNWRTRYPIPGLRGFKLQYINFGFNHQSNGRTEPLSRSWNRLVANVGLEKGRFNTLLKTWYRIPEDEEDDDNPDIMRYMGNGELWLNYVYKDNRFAVMLRNNLRHEDRGAVQVDLSMPLASIWKPLGRKFALYVQYFNGYGECLLDYDDSSNRIGAGFMVVDWL